MEEKEELAAIDINNLTAEILILKQQTAQNIIEIGKRLIKVKESLPYGEWGKYLEKKVNFSQPTASRFIRSAETFKDYSTLNNLTQSKIFALLDVPSEEREDFITSPHEVNGEVKTVDDMTTRQLQQAIKEKKEAEIKALQLEKDKQELQKKLTIAENKPAETVEIPVEIDNTDYTVATKNKELENNFKKLSSEKANLQTKLQLMTAKAEAYSQDSAEYQKMKEDITCLTQQKDDLGRQILAITDISGLVIEIDHLIKDKLAPVRYSKSLLEAKDDEIVLRNLTSMVETVEQWCSEMRKYVPNKINYVEVIQ